MSIKPTSCTAQAPAPVHRDLLESMQDWIRAGDPSERAHREQLSENVRRFLDTGEHLLEISNLDISELPQFLCHPNITRQLQQLSVNRTLIEQVPEWIDQLSQLQKLVLEDNFHIEGLPRSIGNLSRLTCLDISFIGESRELQEFEFPDSIRRLRLHSLALSGIEGGLIQTWLDSQVDLTRLRLNSCDYDEIPSEIFQLRHLTDLDLTGNDISEIDDRIQHLTHLERVNFSSNSITSVNQGVFLLDGGCQVYLQENHLSAEELARVDSIIEEDSYRGPEFTTDAEAYSVSEPSSEDEERDITDRLRSFYEAIGIERPAHIDVLTEEAAASRALGALLGRLERHIPYSHSFAPGIYAVLAESLSLAAQNPEYRLACFHVIEGATNTCGDGIIAIILRLGLLRQELLLDLDQPTQVLYFILKGKFCMALLEARAANHVAEQKIEIIHSIRAAHPLIQQEELERLASQRYEQEIDPVEVYLVYPIALRERLELPLPLTSMLFAAHAHVTHQQLSEAADHVEERLGDKACVLDFLVKDELWLKLLEKEFPRIFSDLAQQQEKLADLPEEGMGEDPYVAFAHEKQRVLLEATRQLLDRLELSLSGAPAGKRTRLTKME